MSLALICRGYAALLGPVPPFTWLGASISTLDVLAAVRLCAVMRQLRDANHRLHDGTQDEHAFVKHVFATFTVVYGGEALSGGVPYHD